MACTQSPAASDNTCHMLEGNKHDPGQETVKQGVGLTSIIPYLMLSSIDVMRPKSKMARRASGVLIRFPAQLLSDISYLFSAPSKDPKVPYEIKCSHLSPFISGLHVFWCRFLTWVGVCHEEASVQQLLEVADNAHIDQGCHIICFALAQLLPINPLRREHSPSSVVCVCPRHNHLDVSCNVKMLHMDACVIACMHGSFLAVA